MLLVIVIILSVIHAERHMVNIIMQNVIMLSVFMLNVMSPPSLLVT
jgi:hypothetical protein